MSRMSARNYRRGQAWREKKSRRSKAAWPRACVRGTRRKKWRVWLLPSFMRYQIVPVHPIDILTRLFQRDGVLEPRGGAMPLWTGRPVRPKIDRFPDSTPYAKGQSHLPSAVPFRCQAECAGRTWKCNFWDGRRIAVTDASLRVAWPERDEPNPARCRKRKRSGLPSKGTRRPLSGFTDLHSRRVYSLCLRMVSNTAEAEDLTQEAFLQLFRKIATFRGESAFSTWLASAGGQCRADEVAEEIRQRDFSRASDRAGRRIGRAAAGFWRPGSEAQRLD